MIKRSLCGAIALAAALLGGAASAEEFPSQPIKLVTPYPPGGALSVHAAIITTAAEPHFGQPMVSIIRAGGGGAVGAAFVAKSKPDGYTILLGEPTINSLRPQIENLPYKVDDLIPIARITQTPIIFVASAKAPFDDLKGMIEYAKAKPGELVYSSDNVNGWTYTAFEMLKKATGTQMKGIDFGGGGPALTNVLGGNTMAYAGDPSIIGDQVRQGQLKGICVAADSRYEPLPDIPTCKEAGADVQWGLWLGIFAPKGTPTERVDKLRAGFKALLADEGFLRLMARINSKVGYQDMPEFAEFLKREQSALKGIAN